MSAKFLTLAVAGLMGLSLIALADPGFSSLEERMTGREFRETGLYKLSEDELAALNRWIRQRSLAEEEPRQAGSTAASDGAGPAASEDRRGLRSSEDRSTIESRIVGSFTGWRGRTEFELENGQVWRQAESGTFVVPEIQNPDVEIIPGMFNSWRLRVSGYNTRVRVERIR